MKTSRQGLEFIAAWEGVELEIYLDAAGYPTIGVGHLIVDGEDFSDGLTHEEAMALFAEDIAIYENAVNRHTQVLLTQHQFDALVSFTFNLGEGNFSRSTLLRRVNAKMFHDVPYQLSRWNRAGGIVLRGLVRRRKAEGRLFADGVYQGP